MAAVLYICDRALQYEVNSPFQIRSASRLAAKRACFVSVRSAISVTQHMQRKQFQEVLVPLQKNTPLQFG
jgi:hypothetical protein